MSKSTYSSAWILNPHLSSEEEEYPHKDLITFIVVTRYAPKSTYSPRLNNELVEWSDRFIGKVVDDMMGITEEYMEMGDIGEEEEI